MTKFFPLLFIGALLLAIPGPSQPASGSPEGVQAQPGGCRVVGTWEHAFDDAPAHRQVKVINRTISSG
jgi:hypothetical protein